MAIGALTLSFVIVAGGERQEVAGSSRACAQSKPQALHRDDRQRS